MYKRPDRRQQVSRLAIIYTVMTLAVVGIVSIMVMFVMGYRFDASQQRFEQTGLVQFNSRPTGAVVEIDKKRLGGRTPTKRNLTPGVHEFAIWQQDYETWWKSIDIKAGSLTWLDYAILVPKQRQVNVVQSYEQLDQTLFSPGGRFLSVWQDSTEPTFDIVDLRLDDDIKTQSVRLDTDSLAGFSNNEASHKFELKEWDQSGRYLLVTHKTGSQLEWLLVDREDSNEVVNITSLVDLPISDAQLSGTNGDVAYIQTDNMIRRVNLETGEISRALASRVDDFSLYSTDVITYVGRVKDDSHQKVVGLVRTDDTAPHILKTVQGANNLEVNVDTARYFNQNYVAVSIGNTVEIYSGDYPTTETRDDVDVETSGMMKLASFQYDRPIEWMQFSGNGRFVIAQDERGFISYDLERKQAAAPVEFDGAVGSPVDWLDSYHLWTVEDGQLVMQEFDGANRHEINTASAGYDVSFDEDGGYMYSVANVGDEIQLQRVDMIINR